MSLRTSGASRSESNKMIAGGNHTLILRTLVWQSASFAATDSHASDIGHWLGMT